MRVITISDATGGFEIGEAAPTPSEVDGMFFAYATLTQVPGTKVTLAHGIVPPGAEVPPHAAASAYALYVVAGEGRLTLYVGDDLVQEIAYAPGAVIVFPPHASHGWLNGGDGAFEWFGIDIGDPAEVAKA